MGCGGGTHSPPSAVEDDVVDAGSGDAEKNRRNVPGVVVVVAVVAVLAVVAWAIRNCRNTRTDAGRKAHDCIVMVLFLYQWKEDQQRNN